jgi:hypothetical protein
MLKRVRAWVTHPSTSFVYAVLTAALCAGGSVAFRRFPDVGNRHLGGWSSAPRWHTIWVGALIVAVVAWCVHSVAHLRFSVADRVNRKVNSASRLWTTILQLGWVLALGVFLWLEVRSSDERFVVTANGTDIHGVTYRAVRVEARGRRPGSRRPITAWLERQVGAVTERLRVNRSHWWSSLSGTHQLTMDRANVANKTVILRHGHQRFELSSAHPVQDGSDTIQLNAIRDPDPESSVSVPKVDVTINGRRELLPLDPEWTGENAFLGFKESPVLVLLVRRNLWTSLAVIALASLLVGAIVFWVHARSSRSPR